MLKCEAVFVNGWPPFHVSNTDDAHLAAQRDRWSLLSLYQPGACILGDVTAGMSGPPGTTMPQISCQSPAAQTFPPDVNCSRRRKALSLSRPPWRSIPVPDGSDTMLQLRCAHTQAYTCCTVMSKHLLCMRHQQWSPNLADVLQYMTYK